MRAAVLYQGKIEVRETADPTPGPGEILVRTRACAICASDVHFMDHPHADPDDTMSCYDANADVVMGHEYCAEVVDYGPETERKFARGTLVSSIPVLNRPGAGKRRIIGYAADAPGGFGEYFLMTEALARVVDTRLPDELVALADAMAVGWSYVRRAAVQPNEIPLVIGCGAIGLSAIAALRHRGIGPIMAADFVASRRQTALAMGADIVIDPAEISPFSAWKDVASASMAECRELTGDLVPRRCVVFECVGIPGVLNNIVKSCERDTRIFSAGGPPEGEHLHTMTAKRKGLNMQFGGGPSFDDWDTALAEVASGRLDVTPMTGRIVTLEEMPQAIEASRDASGPPRIVLKHGG